MVRIFQAFTLDMKIIKALSLEQKTQLSSSDSRKLLREGLTSRGYDVLESERLVLGLPDTILIGKDGFDHKKDFYGVITSLSSVTYMASGQTYLHF